MIDTEILQDYSTEARELLEEMDNSLIRLEKEGSSPELLNNIFRAVHCIKGSAEYIGLERSSTLTHGVENLLDRLREGMIQVTPGVIDFLFRVKDLVGSLIDEVTKEREERTDISTVMRELESFADKGMLPDSDEEPDDDEDALDRDVHLSDIVATTELDAELTAALGEAEESEEPTDVFDTDIEPGDFDAEYPTEITEEIGEPVIEEADSDVDASFPEDLVDTLHEPHLEPTGELLDDGLGQHLESTDEPPLVRELSAKATLEETVPQVLNVSLYLDDLEDGLRPRDIVPSLLDTIDNLTRSLEHLNMPQALALLREMESRVDAIDTAEDSPPMDRVSELRTLVRDLQSCYPAESFPHDEPTLTQSELISPPEIPAERAAFFSELAKIPGVDQALMEAIHDSGFTSMAQLVQSDMETLTAIPEMPFSVAETILGKVVEIPEEAKRQPFFSRPEEHSMLADVDDELLGEFQGVFGAVTPAAAEVAIHQAVESIPGGVASDLLSQVESLGEETDREIVEIFVSYGWEIMEKMAPLVDGMEKGKVGRQELESCADLIKQIRSSSTYMDYQQLASFLDDWYEKALLAADRIESLTPDNLRFMRENSTKLHDFLRGLEAVLKPDQVPAPPPPVVERVAAPKPAPVTATPKPAPVRPVQTAAAPVKPAEKIPTKPAAPPVVATEEPQESKAVVPAPAPPPAVQPRAEDLPQLDETTLARDVGKETPVVRTMRVDAAKVDTLLNQVGELVVNRSYVEQLSFQLKSFQRALTTTKIVSKRELLSIKDIALKIAEASLSLGRTANDLQEGVMKLRMLPVGQLFNRMPRLIRDLSRRVGKQVGLQVQGGDTEVDKRVIEQVYNPLVHLIRNAVDHGIEEAEARQRQGKPDEGTIRLSAYSEGNQVVIDVEDDGRGINVDAVVEKAVATRLIDASDAKSLSTQEIYNFLFVPGFSTSKQVSRTSGRGVGMDVVKKDVEKINGHVEIESWKDSGTRISIKIPLTLAIIQTLLIRYSKHVFAIPLTSVREIIQVSPSEITTIEGFEVVKFRDETIPILRIDEVFNLSNHDPTQELKYLVLATVGLKTVGFPVEELVGESDVVIKPLAEHVFKSRGLAGSTILGDGTIALVMDVGELIEDVVARYKQLRFPTLTRGGRVESAYETD